MLNRSQTTTFLQIFFELLLYSHVILKSMRVADDTLEGISECEWVKVDIYDSHPQLCPQLGHDVSIQLTLINRDLARTRPACLLALDERSLSIDMFNLKASMFRLQVYQRYQANGTLPLLLDPDSGT